MSEPGSSLLYLRAPRGLPRRELRAYTKRLSDAVAAGRQFHCLLTDDEELQRLNREFLRKNYPTDVLSFPSASSGRFLGELAISVERAAAQAAGCGHSLAEEIKILMLHGVLHLLGMDHEADNGRMARIEKRWRRDFGLPAGLIERVGI